MSCCLCINGGIVTVSEERFRRKTTENVKSKWQVYTGIGGRVEPESPAGFNRNQWQVCAGIRIYKDLLLNQLDLGESETIILAKEKGIVNSSKPLLDEMIVKGRWYSTRVYENFLKKSRRIMDLKT
ncbi:MAG: DUF3368 domain-containing protein [bacterium]